MSETYTIAVYGTLKRGYRNHGFFLSDQKFLGEGTLGEEFSMYSVGLPYVIKKQGPGAKVELYEVDSYALRNIDDLEGHPRAYRREVVTVDTESGPVEAWVYLYPPLERNMSQNKEFAEDMEQYLEYDY